MSAVAMAATAAADTYKIIDIDYTYSNGKLGNGIVHMYAKRMRDNMDIRIECKSWMPYFYLRSDKWTPKGVATSLKLLAKSINTKSKTFVHETTISVRDGYGYSPSPENFFKVEIADPRLRATFFERVIVSRQRFLDYKVGDVRSVVRTGAYMGNVDPVVQIILDTKLYTSAYCIRLRGITSVTPNVALVTYEVPNMNCIVPAPDVSEFIPSLRVMSFDIECVSGSGAFPKASQPDDRIIQIAAITIDDAVRNTSLDRYSEGNVGPNVHIFTLGSCSPLRTGGVVHACSTEAELLNQFAEYVRCVDPDVLTGYNITGFDIPYILERMLLHNVPPILGRRLDASWRCYAFTEEEEEEGDEAENDDEKNKKKRQLLEHTEYYFCTEDDFKGIVHDKNSNDDDDKEDDDSDSEDEDDDDDDNQVKVKANANANAKVNTKVNGTGKFNGKYANGKYANGKYANGKYANGKYANGKYANGKYANGKYANGKYANGEDTNGKANMKGKGKGKGKGKADDANNKRRRANFARPKMFVATPSRVVIDMYSVIKDSKKLDSYKLNSVSKTLLGEEKDDVPYREIAELQNKGGPDGRKRIADYCVQDAVLPLKLMAITYTMTSALEINRISHVPMRYVYGRGQQVRVLTSVLVESEIQGGYLYPSFAYVPRSMAVGGSYQGATVIPPKIGFYASPVITLDFESLYPSTMRTGNFCITTWIWKDDETTICTEENGFLSVEEVERRSSTEPSLGIQHDDDVRIRLMWNRAIGHRHQQQQPNKSKNTKKAANEKGEEEDEEEEGEDGKRSSGKRVTKKQQNAIEAKEQFEKFLTYIKPNWARLRQGSPNGTKADYFVPTNVREGVMPCMLRKLIEARRAVKKQMASETDLVKRVVLNERQLSIKVIANSVYGFCGVAPDSGYALLPCQPVSRSVTNMGRTLIGATIYHALAYSNEHDLGLRIVYGDTDSIMVLTRTGTSLAEAEDLGDCLSSYITKQFPGVIRLCYEKTYLPYLLVAKKRYVGGHYTNGTFNKIDFKGIEIVRRDSCRYVCNAIRRVIETLMKTASVSQTLTVARSLVAGVRSASKEDLVLSKSFNVENPALAHYQLVLRIKERGDAIVPQIGDRVHFLVCAVNTNPHANTNNNNNNNNNNSSNNKTKKKQEGNAKNKVSKKLADRVEDPVFVASRKLPIDYKYYADIVSTSLARLFKVALFNNSSLLTEEVDTVRKVTIPYLQRIGVKDATEIDDSLAHKIAKLILENGGAGGGKISTETSTERSFKALCKKAIVEREIKEMKSAMLAYLSRSAVATASASSQQQQQQQGKKREAGGGGGGSSSSIDNKSKKARLH